MNRLRSRFSPIQRETQSIYSNTTGQSLAEYSLAGVLVVVVAIAGVTIFSTNLSNATSLLKKEMISKVDTAVEVESYVEANHISWEIASQLEGQAQDDRILLQSNLANMLQTTGANGTTANLAQQMEQAAKNALAAGQLTQEQSDILLRLANKAHEMASIERILEDYISSSGSNGGQYNNSTFNYQGQMYTARELSKLVAFGTLPPWEVQDPFDSSDSGIVLKEFQDLYRAAEASGALSDPQISDLVVGASTQIIITGEYFEDAYYNYEIGAVSGTNEFNGHMASLSTDNEAGKVCSSGGRNDNGSACR